MRIIHWSDCYPPFRGGTETVVHRLATTMAADGHDVAVITNSAEGLAPFETDEGVAIHRFGFRDALERTDPGAILATVRGVATVKRAFAADVVHLHFLGASCFFHLRTADASPCPTLVTIHGGLGGCTGGTRNLLGQLLDSADWITGVSQAMMAEALEVAPDAAARTSVVYNGDEPHGAMGPLAASPLLLCFGRHVYDKGFDLAIAAMPAIRAAHPEARLVIGSDGPDRAALEAQAEALGLADAVSFTGWMDTDRLRALIAQATAVIVPSRWKEGFGLVALEAALAGRPVIATAIGGLPEVVLDGRTGLLIEPHSAPAISKAVVRLLDDPEWCEALGAAALLQVKRFGLRKQIDAFTALYAGLKEQADATH